MLKSQVKRPWVGCCIRCCQWELSLGDSFSASTSTYKSSGSAENVRELNFRDVCAENNICIFCAGLSRCNYTCITLVRGDPATADNDVQADP
jgi:hypothetical protein